MNEKSYYARTNISLDGVEYSVGAVVPLSDKQATELKDAVSLPIEPDDALTQEQVVAAIGSLNPEDSTHWTKSGKPQIDALEALLKAPVSGKLRDVAWAVIEPGEG